MLMLTGSISTGTLKVDDLIEAFANTLQNLAANADHLNLAEEALAFPEPQNDDEANDAFERLIALSDALQEYAPEGYYFGAHPGDGADFGFWPVQDA